jgi:NitT/TauT family transport system permease protein
MRAAAEADSQRIPAPPPAAGGPEQPDRVAAFAGTSGRRAALDTAMVLLVLVLAWQLGSFLLGPFVLPSPLATVVKLGAIMREPDFAGHAWETARAFGLALVIALAGGLAVGIVLGAHRLSGDVAEPILAALYAIPKITLYPVILLIAGLGIWARVTFGVIHGIIPVAIFTMNAVRNIPPVYLRAARSMRLTRGQIAATLIVPAVSPEIVSGFRVGFALTLLGTLIGEMFASQRGIGYSLVQAMETNDVDTVMALAFLLIVLASAASALLLTLERRLHKRMPVV